MIGHTINCVELVVDRYKPNPFSGKENLQMITDSNMVTAQPRKVFDNYTFNFFIKNILDHLLECQTVKAITTETVVYVVTHDRNLMSVSPFFVSAQ